jgi:hypothetical protein
VRDHPGREAVASMIISRNRKGTPESIVHSLRKKAEEHEARETMKMRSYRDLLTICTISSLP